mmetsp:Transcript_24940/g.83789  ORF Transcript_24940/g.83789 Transcript_24940/m.83789 type:complete len:272 (-) Transcript_24940:786-1601(-)
MWPESGCDAIAVGGAGSRSVASACATCALCRSRVSRNTSGSEDVVDRTAPCEPSGVYAMANALLSPAAALFSASGCVGPRWDVWPSTATQVPVETSSIAAVDPFRDLTAATRHLPVPTRPSDVIEAPGAAPRTMSEIRQVPRHRGDRLCPKARTCSLDASHAEIAPSLVAATMTEESTPQAATATTFESPESILPLMLTSQAIWQVAAPRFCPLVQPPPRSQPRTHDCEPPQTNVGLASHRAYAIDAWPPALQTAGRNSTRSARANPCATS